MKTATAPSAEWRNPAEDEPPRGEKMLILNGYGVAITGCWRDGSGFLAWTPLPRRPAWLRG